MTKFTLIAIGVLLSLPSLGFIDIVSDQNKGGYTSRTALILDKSGRLPAFTDKPSQVRAISILNRRLALVITE